MKTIDFNNLMTELQGIVVERPNKASSGTLSGHAAGEPFEKSVYYTLKRLYPKNIYKQHEYLNDIFLKNPKVLTVKDRRLLFKSPTVLYLISRGDKATNEWSATNLFEEKQNDTADILFHSNGFFDFIDVKTRNFSKQAQPPNIISAYKLANTCAYMIDNADFDVLRFDYIEIDWLEQIHKDILICQEAHHGALFDADPNSLYINWSSGMQVQFHVSQLDNSWSDNQSIEKWARTYIAHFVKSASERCTTIREKFVTPFLKYIE